MLIHKSHSKSELVRIIQTYNIDICNPKHYRKIDLSAILVDKLKTMDNIKPNEEFPFLNIIELKHHLIQVNPKKRLTIKQKNDIVMITKKIKQYCRNHYNIETSQYNCINDLENDIDYISQYGEIPSVRMAIRELNENPQKTKHYTVYIPPIIKRELDKKHKLKYKICLPIKIQKGLYTIQFS